MKDGPASRCEDLKGGRQQQHTRAESGGLIKKVICAAGGEKIHLEVPSCSTGLEVKRGETQANRNIYQCGDANGNAQCCALHLIF